MVKRLKGKKEIYKCTGVKSQNFHFMVKGSIFEIPDISEKIFSSVNFLKVTSA